MATSTQSASDGTRDVSEGMSGVARTIENTNRAGSEVLIAARELSGLSERLRSGVTDFIGALREA